MRDQMLTFYADWLGFDPTSTDLTDEQRSEVAALSSPPTRPRTA